MAAAPSEADKLRQQIAFLTNLINSARAPGQPAVHGLRHPSQTSLSYGQVRGQMRPQWNNSFNIGRPTYNRSRFPSSHPYGISNRTTAVATPSRVMMGAGNRQFPLANSAPVVSHQAHRAAGTSVFNRPTQINNSRTVYQPNVNQPSNQNIPVSSNNIRNVIGSPIVQQQQQQQQQLLSHARMLQQDVLQRQGVPQDAKIGANYMQMSRHNADICVNASQATHTGMLPGNVSASSQMLSLQTNTTSHDVLTPDNPRSALVPSRPGDSASASSSNEEPKMQQMAVLMEELQKTQTKIQALQNQLMNTSQNTQPPPPPPQQQQPAAFQSQVAIQSIATPGGVAMRMQSAMVNPASGISAVHASSVIGHPLAQTNKVWSRYGTGQPLQFVRNMSTQQVVGRPITAAPVWSKFHAARQVSQHTSALTGSGLVKPLHRHMSPAVVNTRFQSQVMANNMQQSVQAAQTHSVQQAGTSQVLMSKYKLQKTVPGIGTAHTIVSKYKIEKSDMYGNRSIQMNYFNSKYMIQPARYRPSYVPRYMSRYALPPTMYRYPRRYMWRGVPRLWQTYQQRAAPWNTQAASSYQHVGGYTGRYPQSTSRVWKKHQWLSWKQKSRLTMKNILQKRLHLLRRSNKHRASRLKFDRRQKATVRRLAIKDSPRLAIKDGPRQSSSSRHVLINGILYKSSSTTLTKAVPPQKALAATVRGTKTQPLTGKKRSVVVKQLNAAAMKTISVRGVKFRMDSSGRSLQRIDQTQSPTKSVGRKQHRAEIKRVDIGGVTFIQTKPGTLVRSTTVRTRAVASRVKSRVIIAATNSLHKDNTKSVNGYCVFYNKFGRCRLGTRCPYKHDPSKVAVCTRFLRGTCKVDSCPFSHKVARDKMPVCSYFLRGLCNRDNCPYLHVKVSKDAEVCQDFVRGFCPRGEQCSKKHTLRCPTFAESGSCPRGKKCPMLHKRSAKRLQTNRSNGSPKSGEQRQTEDVTPASDQTTSMTADVTARETVKAVGSTNTYIGSSQKTSVDASTMVCDNLQDLTSTAGTLIDSQSGPSTAPVLEDRSEIDSVNVSKHSTLDSESTRSSSSVTADGKANDAGSEQKTLTAPTEVANSDTTSGDRGVPANGMKTTAEACVQTTSDMCVQTDDPNSPSPEKLPSFISLADISMNEENLGSKSDGGQSSTESSLHIRPRL
ncbi:uncharacterized protein [Haliotis asinina]|uniref:uncharacterized protein n=1 Tax=Haliotis asinina TaxID=109174 RepID=UPI003531E49C